MNVSNRIGVLDIGSNSVRFVIYELFGSAFSPIYTEKVLAGLGRALNQSGALSPEGRESALAALKRFRHISEAHGLKDVLIAATAAMRMASDAEDFVQEAKDATGWDISAISGWEEARLSAQGLLAAEPRADGVAADLGGASLELIRVADQDVKFGESFALGPFKLFENPSELSSKFDVNTLTSQIEAVLNAAKTEFQTGQALYLIGGAWRNLGLIHQKRHLYPMKTVQAYTLMPGAAMDLARWAYGHGREDLLSWPGIAKRRAETLPYSGLLLEILLKRLKPSKVILSTTGLREGLVYDHLPKSVKQRDALLDGCQDLAQGNLRGTHFADPLLTFLKPLKAVLPRAFEADNEHRLRRAACHLVGIGKGLHPDYRAELVFEQVFYAPLAGLTHKERAYLALILFHTFTSSTEKIPNRAAIHLHLSRHERRAARTFGSAIRLAVVASARAPQLLDEFSLEVTEHSLAISVPQTYAELLTDRLILRLEKLADLLGLKADVRCVP